MELIDRKKIMNGDWKSVMENSPSSLWAKNTLSNMTDLVDIPLAEIPALSPDQIAPKMEVPDKLDTSKEYKLTKNPIDWKEIGKTTLNSLPGMLGFAGQLAKQFDPDLSTADLVANTLSTTRYVNDMPYSKKYLNGAKVMGSYKNGKLPGFATGYNGALSTAAAGAGAGAAFGPWGAAIGGAAGLLGGILGANYSEDKQREMISEYNSRLALENAYARNNAWAQGQQIKNARKNDANTGMLGFKDGKLPGFFGGKVSTSSGLLPGIANAKTDGDELIINTRTGEMYQNPPSRHTDSYNSYILPEDMIIPGDESKRLLKRAGFKNGRLPGFDSGKRPDWGNLSAALFGGAASLALLFDARNSNLADYSINTTNGLGNSALSDYARRRVYAQPAIDLINNAARSSAYNIQNSAASTLDKNRALVALSLGQQRNLANAITNSQMQNNQYLGDLALAKASLGTSSAQLGAQGLMFNKQYTSQAHNAKLRGVETAMSNMLAQYQSYLANAFKKYQFENTLDLYRTNQKMDMDKFNLQLAQMNKWNYRDTQNPLETTMSYLKYLPYIFG